MESLGEGGLGGSGVDQSPQFETPIERLAVRLARLDDDED
ncbi:hypothetical protein GCM10010399_22000 [Dactylosporangium fulvum]|uniref:DUF6104 family protein n=1 Tax=Dactylosporangium fulvum TaxID=53359 RepID=A0ABY5W8B0_9ACTN|nr:DUF6104 family protein [Dactylosporangium fulvum]UWP85595.1 DUF6104 family protein [Dactylosporangium fulvum]